jgi:hypothetical protein
VVVVTTLGPVSFWRTALAVLLLAVAMGYLEAAVVVYLRAALEAVPGAVPAHEASTLGTFEVVEIVRELATLVMIGAAGWLAGRSGLERLAWAAVIFGIWDIVYYAGLRLTIGWPEAFDTWDLLFLVPMPWVGPVWAPMVVSIALIVFGLAAARRLRAGGTLVLSAAHILAGLAGGALVITSFLIDADRVIGGDTGPWTAWPIFWAGMMLAVVAALSALLARPPTGSARSRP